MPSASLKDSSDGCVLLCNLSEPEVEEASLADCEESSCLVAEADNTLSPVTENKTAEVECCSGLNLKDCNVASSHSEHSALQQTSAASVVTVQTSDRRKRSVNQHLVMSRKKQKRQ